jgi:hemerythrin superfamily protein
MADGFTWLEDDHRAIEAKFETFQHDEESTTLRELCEHLTRHARLEESALYPQLRRYVDGGDDLADRAEQEHATVQTMIAELLDSATPDRVVNLVADMRSLVEAHVETEESEIFPAMRECRVDPAKLAVELGA